MKQKQKGSVLAYSLIIISLMLIVSTGIALTATIDRKSSSVTNKSSQAYQAAESSAEVFIRDMGAASTIADLNNAEHPCDATTGLFNGTILETAGGETKDYSIALYNGNFNLNCQNDSSQLLTQVSRIVAMGKYAGTERDIEVELQSALPSLPSPGGSCVNTCNELIDAIESSVSGDTIRMCNHIDCAGNNRFPIGVNFNATLDGESGTAGSNFTISNISSDENGSNKAGMISTINTGTIKNLNFSNIVVHSTRGAGGIAAEALEGSTLRNIEMQGLNMLVDGNPGASGDIFVGGAVGKCLRCNLREILVNGSIRYSGRMLSGNYVEIGGVVGNLNRENGGSMEAQQLASGVDITHGGEVTGNMAKIGGLAGVCEKGAAIRDSYASGSFRTLAGSEAEDNQFHMGGFVGGADNCTVESSYARVEDFGSGGLFRGFAGNVVSINTANNAYWSTDAILIGGCASCLGRTDVQLQTSSTFGSWDDTTIWRITDNNFPCLRGVTC